MIQTLSLSTTHSGSQELSMHCFTLPFFFNPSSVHLFLNSLLLTVSSVSLTPTVFAPLTTPLLHYLKYYPEPFPSLPIHLAHLINPRPPFTWNIQYYYYIICSVLRLMLCRYSLLRVGHIANDQGSSGYNLRCSPF